VARLLAMQKSNTRVGERANLSQRGGTRWRDVPRKTTIYTLPPYLYCLLQGTDPPY